MYNKPQKLVAEFIGTFALIFFGVGSICADQFLRTSGRAGRPGIAGHRPRARPGDRHHGDVARPHLRRTLQSRDYDRLLGDPQDFDV